jgi:hypothetical protein
LGRRNRRQSKAGRGPVLTASHFWHRGQTVRTGLHAILERRRFSGHIISSCRLYCDPKALWKFNWFLRDFGYEVELLGRDEVNETQLIGLTGVVKIGNVILSCASAG